MCIRDSSDRDKQFLEEEKEAVMEQIQAARAAKVPDRGVQVGAGAARGRAVAAPVAVPVTPAASVATAPSPVFPVLAAVAAPPAVVSTVPVVQAAVVPSPATSKASPPKTVGSGMGGVPSTPSSSLGSITSASACRPLPTPVKLSQDSTTATEPYDGSPARQ